MISFLKMVKCNQEIFNCIDIGFQFIQKIDMTGNIIEENIVEEGVIPNFVGLKFIPTKYEYQLFANYLNLEFSNFLEF